MYCVACTTLARCCAGQCNQAPTAFQCGKIVDVCGCFELNYALPNVQEWLVLVYVYTLIQRGDGSQLLLCQWERPGQERPVNQIVARGLCAVATAAVASRSV